MTSKVGEGIPQPDSAAVELAYGIALSSYVSAREQWESVHRRLDTLLSFVTTVTIAAPVAAEAVLDEPDFSSLLIVSAGAVYLLIVLIALIARSFGAIQQISPRELHANWLQYTEEEFREGIIDWSGDHNDHAQVLIDRKNLAANVMALLFAAESLLVIAWVVTGG